MLEKLGAWEAIAAYRQCAYRHMTVWDAEGTGQIEFDCADVNAPALGHIVENRAIVSALLDRVGRGRGYHRFSPATLQACSRQDGPGAMRVELDDGDVLEADLLVAADGALSRVREMMGFNSREWDYGHRAIVTTVEVERPHQATGLAALPAQRPAGLPAAARARLAAHYCSIVWSLQEDLVDDLLALDEAAFCAELERAFEARLGRVLACCAPLCVSTAPASCRRLCAAGVALVADAAHTIHPLAGQGINLGLQDVAVLAEEVLAGRARGVSPGQLELLRRYQRRRKGENLLMMAAMDGFKRLFEQQALPLRWLRNAGMRGVSQMGPLKQQLMRHAMGVG